MAGSCWIFDGLLDEFLGRLEARRFSCSERPVGWDVCIRAGYPAFCSGFAWVIGSEQAAMPKQTIHSHRSHGCKQIFRLRQT